jgi:hypothetical protein
MTFPVVEASAITEASADQSSHTVNLPSGITAGDLLLLWFTLDGSSGVGVDTPSGWDLVEDTIAQTNGDKGCLFSRTASGSEGATVVVTSTGTDQSSACVSLRISGWQSVETENGSEQDANVGITLPPLTPSTSGKGLLLTCVCTLGTRDTLNHAVGATVVKTTYNASSQNTTATVLYSQLTVSDEHELIISHGMRQSSASTYCGVIVFVAGGAISGGIFHPLFQQVIG